MCVEKDLSERTEWWNTRTPIKRRLPTCLVDLCDTWLVHAQMKLNITCTGDITSLKLVIPNDINWWYQIRCIGDTRSHILVIPLCLHCRCSITGILYIASHSTSNCDTRSHQLVMPRDLHHTWQDKMSKEWFAEWHVRWYYDTPSTLMIILCSDEQYDNDDIENLEEPPARYTKQDNNHWDPDVVNERIQPIKVDIICNRDPCENSAILI